MRLFIILWFLTFSSFASVIGDVILHEGNAIIERTDGEDVDSEIDLDIFSYDTIKTGKGNVAIGFIDDTRVDITQHSKICLSRKKRPFSGVLITVPHQSKPSKSPKIWADQWNFFFPSFFAVF